VRRLLIGLVAAAALAVPAAAAATTQPPTPMSICTSCDGGGGGSTGCWQETWWSDRGVTYVASIHHYIVMQWCKQQGTITWISIYRHGCDSSGFAHCSTGPAFITAGGVGYGWAEFEGHAQVWTTLPRSWGWNFTDVVSGSIAPG
jgi:hypothetical protein